MKKSIEFSSALLCSLLTFSAYTALRTPNQSAVAELLAEEYMNRALYAPWGEEYLANKEQAALPRQPDECVFCLEIDLNDNNKTLTLARLNHTVIMLNPYPYTRGHLLIVPRYHVKYLHELSEEARAELMEAISSSMQIMKTELKIEGANVGINFERVGGASIPDHLHVQIVPRQYADADFMKIIGNTKVVCWDLHKLYLSLKPCFDKLEIKKTEDQ